MTQTRRRSVRPAGFTLVESAVSVAIAAVLVELAVLNFGALIEKQRLEGAAAQLAADLQLLRTEAHARSQSLRLSIYNAGAASCCVIHIGSHSDCSCQAEGGAVCSDPSLALKSVHWRAGEPLLNSNVGSLVYDPAQATVTPTGSLRVIDGRGRTITHVVNIVGRVRSCSPAPPLPGYVAC